MKKQKQNRAITLIALIITVIIILILAGVSISVITGQDSIFTKTHRSVDKYAKEYLIEQANISIAELKMYLYEKNETKSLAEYIKNSVNSEIILKNGSKIYENNDIYYLIDNKGNMVIFSNDNGNLLISDVKEKNEIEWKTITYISEDMTGGELPKIQNEIAGSSVKINFSNIPEKDGYVFWGWSRNPMDNEPEYEYNNKNTLINMPNNNLTLYAIYAEDKETFTYNNSNKYQIYIAKDTGTYQLEVWGAGSGNIKGGYSKGNIDLNKGDILYIYTGEAGIAPSGTNNAVGGRATFNGGGKGGNAHSSSYKFGGKAGYSGGGATDIRTIAGEWNDENSLNSRIIVAGGAGGVSGHPDYASSAGYGGGLVGGDTYSHRDVFKSDGATQTTGYKKGEGQSGRDSKQLDYYDAEGNGGRRRRLLWRVFISRNGNFF